MAPMWIPKFMSCTSQVGERPERAARALERREAGGRPARRLDRRASPAGNAATSSRSGKIAFAGQQRPVRASRINAGVSVGAGISE